MLGSIISAGAGLLGGIFGNKSAESNMQAQIDLQKEFAKNGIRWRVQDAKQAGIHPLAALGAQTHSYAPMAFQDSMGPALASAGQDIGRAIDATRTAPERAGAYVKTVQDLNVQRLGLENELLASQIAKIRSAGSPPPMPSGGSPGPFATTDGPAAAFAGGNSILADGGPAPGTVITNPQERVTADPRAPYQEPGAVTDRSFVRTDSGGLAPVYSTDAKARLEDDLGGMISWNVRNRLMPSLVPSSSPPYEAPWHSHWEYDVLRQEYKLIRHAK